MAFDPVTAALDIGGKIIDRIWPDPAQAAQAKAQLVELQTNGALQEIAQQAGLMQGQVDVDKVEAASPSTFVAGWRPFIGWICGVGLGFQFIISPLATWGCHLAGKAIIFPALDTGTMVSLVLNLLGLGAMRTVEKLNGVGGGLK